MINYAYDLKDADEVEYVNIGPGADWMVLLTTFANVAWVLFQGPGILKKSIEGWEWLINKLKSLIKKDLLVYDAKGKLYETVSCGSISLGTIYPAMR